MIVIPQTIPKAANSIAIGMPESISQNMFATVDTAPPRYTISFPNGQKDSEANLKHWSPIGIPTIVMHQSTPAAHQLSPDSRPPHMNQSIFPRQLIVFHLIMYIIYYHTTNISTCQ